MRALDELIGKTQTVLIIGSRPLDFDCLGTGLVLKKYLESKGRKVTFMFPGKISRGDKDYYGILPYFEEIITADTRMVLSKRNFDLLVLLDGSNWMQFYDSTRLDVLKYAFLEEMARKIPEYPRGIIMWEQEPGNINIHARGSNRCNNISLPELFAKLSGNSGGHFNAAGMGIEGNFKEVREKLVRQIKEESETNPQRRLIKK